MMHENIVSNQGNQLTLVAGSEFDSMAPMIKNEVINLQTFDETHEISYYQIKNIIFSWLSFVL